VKARLVLASASLRRAQILTALRIPFRVVVSNVDETIGPEEDGAGAAERLARKKAEAVAGSEELPVLAADTVVVCEGQVLGKPASPEDAARMLRMLSARRHEVVTGVCLVTGGAVRSGIERTSVSFASMTDEQVGWYVATGEPMDKAGAYHVDGIGSAFIASLSGSPSNVAGLPVRLVLRLAREAGLALGPP
jgi:septum formation protein